VPGAPVHAVQRGHNRAAVFFDDFDYLEYLRCLRQEAEACGCVIHAYVLMTNHVHLLLSPERSDSLGRLFQGLGRHYVGYVNHTYQRRGSLWEGRYKSNIVDSASYLLSCMRYIELNPVRAGMVDHPAKYRWSSYAANALGEGNAVVTPHAEYVALSRNSDERRAVYRAIFDRPDDVDELAHFRAALRSGTPLGNAKFKQDIEAALSMKVGHAFRGRPRRETLVSGLAE
jgi:putative transposase